MPLSFLPCPVLSDQKLLCTLTNGHRRYVVTTAQWVGINSNYYFYWLVFSKDVYSKHESSSFSYNWFHTYFNSITYFIHIYFSLLNWKKNQNCKKWPRHSFFNVFYIWYFHENFCQTFKISNEFWIFFLWKRRCIKNQNALWPSEIIWTYFVLHSLSTRALASS